MTLKAFPLPGAVVRGAGGAGDATQGCVEEGGLKCCVKGRAEVGGTFDLNLHGVFWKSAVVRFQLQLFSCKKLFSLPA